MRRPMLILAVITLASTGIVSAADPPERINYQGVLRNDADEPLDGTFAMVFRFFDAPTGGNEISVDAHGAVNVSGGLFNVELGSGTVTDGSGPGTFTTLADVFGRHNDLYLEVEVNGETLSPRTPVAAAGYALNARRIRGVELVSDDSLDIYVDASTGDDNNDGLMPATAKATIQAGVDAAPVVLGGTATVHIAAGTYNESVLIDRKLMRGSEAVIVLEGEGTPSWPPVPMVELNGGGTLETGITVLGFAEIRHVKVTDFADVGISVGFGNLTIDDCLIESNGGNEGLGLFRSEVELRDSVVTNGVGEGPAIEAVYGNICIDRATLTATNPSEYAIFLIDKSELSRCGPGPLTINSGANALSVSGSSSAHLSGGSLCVGSMTATDRGTIRGFGADSCGGACSPTPNSGSPDYAVCEP